MIGEKYLIIDFDLISAWFIIVFLYFGFEKIDKRIQ